MSSLDELEILPGVKSFTLTLGPEYYWSFEPAHLSGRNICFCNGGYDSWKDWIDRGGELISDNGHLKRAVMVRINQAKNSTDEEYRTNGNKLEEYLNSLLEKRKPSCERVI